MKIFVLHFALTAMLFTLASQTRSSSASTPLVPGIRVGASPGCMAPATATALVASDSSLPVGSRGSSGVPQTGRPA